MCCHKLRIIHHAIIMPATPRIEAGCMSRRLSRGKREGKSSTDVYTIPSGINMNIIGLNRHASAGLPLRMAWMALCAPQPGQS